MKNDKRTEEMLLNDENYEKLVKQKIQKDFEKLLKDKKSQKGKYITDIKFATGALIFSKDAVYEVINKQSKTNSYINGVQAEGFLGNNNSDRAKLVSGETNSFVSGDNFIKFIKVKV